jgi:hypothetical protein
LITEKEVFKEHWNEIWTSFFGSYQKQWKKALISADQEQIDALAFCEAARPLLQQALKLVTNAPDDEYDSDGFSEVGSEAGDQNDVPMAIAVEDRRCSFPLPPTIVKQEVQALLKKLKGSRRQNEVDPTQIKADWIKLVEGFDPTLEGVSFVAIVQFLDQLRQQAQAILNTGEWGAKPPTYKKAAKKLCRRAETKVAELDLSKPEEGVVILHNLTEFCRVCEHADELPTYLLQGMASHRAKANEWVAGIETDLASSSARGYAEAKQQRDPTKRMAALGRVTKCMERLQALRDKQVELGMKVNGGETKLVTQIKQEITNDEKDTLRSLSQTCTAKNIAESIHSIYVTATDLADPTILEHSEGCIGNILQQSILHKQRNKFGLKELGEVLVRDFQKGGEIVLNQPLFEEINRQAFQDTAGGKTPEGVVEAVAQLNKFKPKRAARILATTKQVYAAYEQVLHDSRFHVDMVKIVSDIKRKSQDIPFVIGGVFAVWSLNSISEKCQTANRPLSAQVVAIVRLLGLDSPPKGMVAGAYAGVVDWWSNRGPIHDANHLAQIKTGQGKSVILGVLATVLSLVGYRYVSILAFCI